MVAKLSFVHSPPSAQHLAQLPAESSPADPTDKALIEGCQAGDALVWEQLIDRYQRLVMSVPLSYGFDSAESEDIAQITFTILMQSLNSLRTVEYLGSWLYTVARRHTWRALKRSQRTSPEAFDDNIAEAQVLFGREGLAELDRRELVEWINQALNQLDQRGQLLITALYFDPDEPDYAAVAKQLGISLGSIGPLRGRYLKKLQHILQQMQISP